MLLRFQKNHNKLLCIKNKKLQAKQIKMRIKIYKFDILN